MSIPKAMQGIYDETVPLITDFCSQYLNEEYCELCLRLLEKLCRKRPSPLLSGRKNTWAAGIVYVIASNNYIFDRSQEFHMTAEELCAPFGLAKSTVSNKARDIRNMADIGWFDPEWQVARLAEENPAIWTLSVNGFILDIRFAPVELQERAFQLGLIPYVPAYRKKAEKEETEEKEETPEPVPPEETAVAKEQEKQEKPDDFSDIYKAFGVEPELQEGNDSVDEIQEAEKHPIPEKASAEVVSQRESQLDNDREKLP